MACLALSAVPDNEFIIAVET